MDALVETAQRVFDVSFFFSEHLRTFQVELGLGSRRERESLCEVSSCRDAISHSGKHPRTRNETFDVIRLLMQESIKHKLRLLKLVRLVQHLAAREIDDRQTWLQTCGPVVIGCGAPPVAMETM